MSRDPGPVDPAEPAESGGGANAVEPPPPLPLLSLRDGLPDIVETEAAFAKVCVDFAAGTGPVAIDAERASGYRYSGRAYLVQLRREGSGTALIDPIPLATMAPLGEALGGAEWILHAATQDLACLAEVGLRPPALFDTELAGRLLGYPKVGLATLVEIILGRSMRKEHSAQDWSTRPLPRAWLEYAALDVEALLELRTALGRQLEDAGKLGWAREEFEQLLSFAPAVRSEPWRRTSGLHKVRGRRGLGAVRELWETRDRIARERDVAPGRILPDSALVEAALAQPTDRQALLAARGFRGRGARRYAREWVAALDVARAIPEVDLPARAPQLDGPPPPRAWAEKDPVAARRLSRGRSAVAALSSRVEVPAENLLTPEHLRRLLWAPPVTRDPDVLPGQVGDVLLALGARPWQVELTAALLAGAVIAADVPEPVLEPVLEQDEPVLEPDEPVLEPDQGPD